MPVKCHRKVKSKSKSEVKVENCPRLVRRQCDCSPCDRIRLLLAPCAFPFFFCARSLRTALPWTFAVFPLCNLRSAAAAARASLPTLCGRLAFDSSEIPRSALPDAHLWRRGAAYASGEGSSRSWLPGHPVDSSLYTARISRSNRELLSCR